MPELHMVVCMKVVPKPEEIRVDPATRRLEREGARSEINPPDMNAIEMALQLRDRHKGKVSLLSMGPPLVEPFLRVGLAMGADRAYLLSDRKFAGADTLATSYTLAKGIEKIGLPDLIICGEESSDGATGQVPAGLAEWLDLPQITLAAEVEVVLERRLARGRRDIRGGYEVLEVPLPAVISMKTASNQPRFMDYEIKQRAFQAPLVTVWGGEDLEVEEGLIGASGSPTRVSSLAQAPLRQRKREFLEGNPEQIARQLAELIRRSLS